MTSPVVTPPPKKRGVARNLKAEGRIADWLANAFNEQEMVDLAYEVGVNYEALLGQGLTGKAQALVSHFARRELLPEFVNQLTDERPSVDWHTALIDTSELK